MTVPWSNRFHLQTSYNDAFRNAWTGQNRICDQINLEYQFPQWQIDNDTSTFNKLIWKKIAEEEKASEIC